MSVFKCLGHLGFRILGKWHVYWRSAITFIHNNQVSELLIVTCCVGLIGCCVFMASAPYHIHASLWWSPMAHTAQVSGFPIATCSLWELLGVACSWHRHPITLMLHCGDHRWCTGIRVSNFNLLYVGLVGCWAPMASTTNHLPVTLWCAVFRVDMPMEDKSSRQIFQTNPTNMANLLFHFLPLSSIKSRNQTVSLTFYREWTTPRWDVILT